jgi:type II secretory pathway pseudopilin PulG
MAAVIAASLAALLAGAIALYRERRLEARRLRVAARVVQAMIEEVLALVITASKGGLSVEKVWFALPREEIVRLWTEHRDVLAGHLSRQEWITTQAAISDYLKVFAGEPTPGNDPDWIKFLVRRSEQLTAAREALDHYRS